MTLQLRPGEQAAHLPPPQSVSVSFPLVSPSVQVGVVQDPLLHVVDVPAMAEDAPPVARVVPPLALVRPPEAAVPPLAARVDAVPPARPCIPALPPLLP